MGNDYCYDQWHLSKTGTDFPCDRETISKFITRCIDCFQWNVKATWQVLIAIPVDCRVHNSLFLFFFDELVIAMELDGWSFA